MVSKKSKNKEIEKLVSPTADQIIEESKVISEPTSMESLIYTLSQKNDIPVEE